MTTYSVGTTGAPADNRMEEGYQKATSSQSLTIDDTYARLGGQQLAMQNGTQILCLGVDGTSAFYQLDAERSDPSKGIRVLRRVAP